MGKSSKDKRDAYYRLAKEQGWRARSAFKLIQLDEQFNLFDDSVTRVVDLCAAPGSWSQVLSRMLIKGEPFGWRAKEEKMRRDRKMMADHETRGEDGKAVTEGEVDESKPKLQPRKNVRIVAIDLQPMTPLDGITILKGDITHPSTIPRILQALDPETDTTPSSTTTPSPPASVDIVLSDGAPDVTGLHDFDIYIQAQLLFSALDLAQRVLKPGGKFVAKIFRGKDVDLIYAQLKVLFERVRVAKPRSSRASSVEAFVVCEGFQAARGVGDQDGGDGVGVGEGVTEREREMDMSNSTSVSTDETGSTLPAKHGGGGQTRTVRPDGITILEFDDDDDDNAIGNRWIAPFLACGDLSAWDSDATYALPKDRVSLDPVQPPTNPPYKKALEIRRREGGAYGKTGKVG